MIAKAGPATLAFLVMGLATGCDPGITIGQANPAVTYRGLADKDESRVVLNVETVTQFISAAYYGAPVKVANMSDEPIIVTRAALSADSFAYANNEALAGRYPVNIAASQTAELPVAFNLNASIERVFRRSVQLLVWYQSGGKQYIIHTNLVRKDQ